MKKSPSEPTLATDIFRMPGGKMLGILFMLHGRPWVIGCVLVLAAFTVATLVTSDLRLGMCALMFLFIVCPAIMAFLYISYAIHPDCAFNVLPHSLELLPDRIRITIMPYRPKVTDYDKKYGKDDDKSYGEIGNPTEDTPVEAPRPAVRDIPFSEIRQLDLPIVKFGKKGYGFIYITPKAFADAENYKKCIDMISSNINPAHPHRRNYREE